MAASSTHASSSLLARLLLLFLLAVTTQSRPSVPGQHAKTLDQLFGSHLSALILAPPPAEVSEGSADSPAPSSQAATGLAGKDVGAGRVEVPHFLLDFLQRQRMFRGRSRKSSLRGCFGMKVDRIGSISGLGC